MPQTSNGRTRSKHQNKRANILAAWLIENAAQVNGPENLQLIFNCSGGAVNVELKRRMKIETLAREDFAR